MPCTTILVGKKASYDNSTMIARTDDGHFDVKKLIVVEPNKQPRKYKSKIGHLEIKLPDNPVRYTCTPSVDPINGIWAAQGINAYNVGMTATETITSNARVLGLDPLVRYKKATKKGEKDIIGGIGEEDLVVLVLPYIKTAREGVIRLGELLEKYGTYEMNGIAFNDENEVWWLETIGGHHFIARKLKDEEYVIMPNQFGLDKFDFEDAKASQKENICSKDLYDFVVNNNLYTGQDLNNFNPRLAFGSNSDADHVYNNPRAWFMGRYFNGHTYKWDGENADYKPESDNIPWSFIPERKITIEDIKYVLSSYYQGTPYNVFAKGDETKKGIYRPIGISRTGVTSICQIRSNVSSELKGIQWIGYAANAFNTFIPFYTSVSKVPSYLSDVTLDCKTNNLYWNSRLINTLVDNNYGHCIMHIERYVLDTMSKGHELINKYDFEFNKTKDIKVLEKANQEISDYYEKATTKVLNNVLNTASEYMKVGYNRSDN